MPFKNSYIKSHKRVIKASQTICYKYMNFAFKNTMHREKRTLRKLKQEVATCLKTKCTKYVKKNNGEPSIFLLQNFLLNKI